MTKSLSEGATGADGVGGYPEPDPEATIAVLSRSLRDAIASVNRDALERMMQGEFTTIFYPGGGSDILMIGESSVLTELDFPPTGDPITVDEIPTSLPPINELLLGRVNPDHQVRDVVFSRGWGGNGLGEALFVALEDERGRISVAARVYAPDGFEREQTSGGSPDIRTVALDSKKPPWVFVELDVPAHWHMLALSSVASFLPWDYALHPERNPASFMPDQTAIELAGFGRHQEVTTLDAAAASLACFDELPIRQDAESLTLVGGQEALLVTTACAGGQYQHTALFIDIGEGIVGLYCDGDQEPCADVMRTARVR